jgi:ABC-type xylose transport system permease subunit
MSFIKNVQTLLQQNIREYGMYIAFFVIIVIFTSTTQGLFISSRNIVNLVNATSYIAVLAVGMTLVIVIQHIDLSVGNTGGCLSMRPYRLCWRSEFWPGCSPLSWWRSWESRPLWPRWPDG